MPKRTVFTTITPLPAGVTRQIVLNFLHDHEEMIDLNPLVKERHAISPPPHASADEQCCQWYSLTDKISYFPGVAGDVTYTCAFNDLPTGLQTHCYAPAGLTIRDKWTVGGSLPGEPAQPVELGLQVPSTGLYLREDVDMRCNVVMTSFVKKTLKRSHAALVDRLKIKAQIASTSIARSGSPSIGNQHYHHPFASAPPSRSSSATSSVASAASSPSIYSTDSSLLWSPTTSSVGTSPAPSTKSPPTTYSNSYQNQAQYRAGEYAASQPKSLPSSTPESVSVTVRKPMPPQEPPTPFLRPHQPDWPLRPQPQPQPQPQLPDWPLKPSLRPAQRPRPQTQLYFSAYKPPAPGHHQPGPTEVGTIATNPSTAPTGSGTGALSDDVLWQALGGGRLRASSLRATGSNEDSRNRIHSQGSSHPEYPQMSPYDDGSKKGAIVGLGVVGGMRPVSMPPRLKTRGPLAAAVDQPFVAQLE
ncbi:hypothetical protein C8A03DRAFT_43458 [Achaetomium macrosporum]|uniref:DUF7053 domain-containing protein n=1 Tax=Achaetomium macrosporum TaxID=79813 RepID=A0AAN7CC76_9PEZI|nr:hypothetical protein C8A03DRAFT_43458 [Achaetomium macrosporum]